MVLGLPNIHSQLIVRPFLLLGMMLWESVWNPAAAHALPAANTALAAATQASSRQESVLDLDELAASLTQRTKAVPLSSADLPEVSSSYLYEQPPGLRLPGTNRVLVQTLRCKNERCAPRLALLEPENGTLKVRSRIDLPVLPANSTGLIYEAPGSVKLFTDQTESLLIRYIVTGPQRPALGAKTQEYIAIVNIPKFTLALHTPLSQAGRRGVEPVCTSQVTMTGPGLQIRNSCSCPSPSDCPVPSKRIFVPTADHRFRARPAT